MLASDFIENRYEIYTYGIVVKIIYLEIKIIQILKIWNKTKHDQCVSCLVTHANYMKLNILLTWKRKLKDFRIIYLRVRFIHTYSICAQVKR